MYLASCLWPYRSWRLARCDSTVSALILSKKFRQMGVFPRNTNTKTAEFPSTSTLNATEVETCQQCLLFCFVFVPTGSNWELDTYKSNVEMWTLCQWLLLFFLLISHWRCGFVPSRCLVHDLTSLTYNQQTATILTDGARGATLYHILNRKLFVIIDLFCAVLIYF